MRTRLSAFTIATFVIGLTACATMPRSDGWTTLIDGATGLQNFRRVGDAEWVSAEGSIQASTGGKEQSFLVTPGTYSDFVMRLEFWASVDANSGVFFRCQSVATLTPDRCYEANIFDQRPDPSYGTGAIVDVAKVAAPLPKVGDRWNEMEITARGSHLIVVLNGRTTVDVQDTKHASGPIALQWGRGTIRFRKVQIRD